MYTIIGKFGQETNKQKRKDFNFYTGVEKDTKEEIMDEITKIAKCILSGAKYDDENIQILIDTVKLSRRNLGIKYKYIVGDDKCIILPDVERGVFSNTPEIILQVIEE